MDHHVDAQKHKNRGTLEDHQAFGAIDQDITETNTHRINRQQESIVAWEYNDGYRPHSRNPLLPLFGHAVEAISKSADHYWVSGRVVRAVLNRAVRCSADLLVTARAASSREARQSYDSQRECCDEL
nr:hypothetical protein CFP56_03763 [Quercus suber]